MKDDLIRRQDAIEALLKEANADGAYGYISGEEAEKVLNALPSAEQGWIPVTERLPEEHKEVLTSDSVFGITFDSIHNGKWRKHPIAWMPLPEPWKGEDDDEVH